MVLQESSIGSIFLVLLRELFDFFLPRTTTSPPPHTHTTLHCHQPTFPRLALPILTQDCHLLSYLHLFPRPWSASHLGLGIAGISDKFLGGIMQGLVSFGKFWRKLVIGASLCT